MSCTPCAPKCRPLASVCLSTITILLATWPARGAALSETQREMIQADIAGLEAARGLTALDVEPYLKQLRQELSRLSLAGVRGGGGPPSVEVIAPNGSEIFTSGDQMTVQWTAVDDSAVYWVDIYLSVDGGPWIQIAGRLDNDGSEVVFVPNRPSMEARLRVVATDIQYNTGEDTSDGVFTINSAGGALIATTLADFDLPGSQPFEHVLQINDPNFCAICHAYYDQVTEPYFGWNGSMMAHASRDPLFEAAMVIANQDAKESGDLCLRCHMPRGWLAGRSTPTDGSALSGLDFTGVSCDVCHRMVDPVFSTENPAQDGPILAALRMPPSAADFSDGAYVLDPNGTRRGPFPNASLAHPTLVSPFHRESAFCGTCHDLSNPVFSIDEQGRYVLNALNQPSPDGSATQAMPEQRTYSEWFHSDYNTPTGVYHPEFAGALPGGYVRTCQDCHMRDVEGKGCIFEAAPLRPDLPRHDLTGSNTWIPEVLKGEYVGVVDPDALDAGILRARYMLQNAAEVEAEQIGAQLRVRVTNQTGHKLPTGYPEGRRLWLNVKFRNAANDVIKESGAYDRSTGVLTEDAEIKVYQTKLGIDDAVSALTGIPQGHTFHLVLNNVVLFDNRIPPRGFTNVGYATFGGAPVGYTYDDGQFWDDTFYAIPPDAVSAEVTLNYQLTTREYVEFLRDANTTNSKGQDMYNHWENYDRCPPEEMAVMTVPVTGPTPGDIDGDGDVDLVDFATLAVCFSGADVTTPPGGCTVGEFATCDMDGDGDVDLTDFATFATNYTG